MIRMRATLATFIPGMILYVIVLKKYWLVLHYSRLLWLYYYHPGCIDTLVNSCVMWAVFSNFMGRKNYLSIANIRAYVPRKLFSDKKSHGPYTYFSDPPPPLLVCIIYFRWPMYRILITVFCNTNSIIHFSCVRNPKVLSVSCCHIKNCLKLRSTYMRCEWEN